MSAIASEVLNRGKAPPAFLSEMVAWAKTAPDAIFARNEVVGNRDIYNKVFAELGPYGSLDHRKAVMLEVMRVLAGFESSWDWNEGVDTSRLGEDTPENAEAGAWQVSFDARHGREDLQKLLAEHGIDNGIKFQEKMKRDHLLAMSFVATLMRRNTKHNGPLYKGQERSGIRASLRGEQHSIYPWLKRDAVAEFLALLSA